MHMRDYFLQMARYHVWATDKLLAQIAHISDEHYRQDCGLFFSSIHGTLNHLLVADLHWYSRFSKGRSLQFQLDQEMEHDRHLLQVTLHEAVRRWEPWIETLDEDVGNAPLHYTRISGQAVVAPYCPTLGHVFNHGTHHRGQISAALTAQGFACPELDLAYLLLETQS